MDTIEKMSNAELMKEFEWMINRLATYNRSEQVVYKEKLKNEIMKRMTA